MPGGKLSKAEVHFPDGCDGLVSVVFVLNGVQIMPKKEGTGLRGNNETVSFWPNVSVDTNAILKVTISNEDDTYEHTPDVRVQIEEATNSLGDGSTIPGRRNLSITTPPPARPQAKKPTGIVESIFRALKDKPKGLLRAVA